MGRGDGWLAQARIDEQVLALRPDYRAALVVAEGFAPTDREECHRTAEAMVTRAEQRAREEVGGRTLEELPHVAAWRQAYRAFGAKPQRTRNSVEALLRRVDEGLPRITPLTDAYNALSVTWQVPLGGEDLDAYVGPLRLVRATGEEEFGTLASGAQVVEHPEVGEVVWRDDAGVTCRRWNWRQCHRTRLTDQTRNAVFVADVLDVDAHDAQDRAEQVVAALADALRELDPGVVLSTRILGA